MHEPRPARISVLHVLAPAAVGGLESAVRMLVAGQRRRGHDVLVAPLVSDVGARAGWIDSVRSAGVAVEPLVAPPRGYVAKWRAVSELLAARRPSVVHTHGYHGDIVGGLAARRARLPLVATVHGFLGRDWKERLYEWLQCRLLRGYDAVIAVSQPMAERLVRSGASSARVHVIATAFEGEEPLPREPARRELGLDAQAFHIGWIGRLSHEKGADVMLRALAETPSADVRLSVIGDGAERQGLEALARRLGVDHRVTWHGQRADAARLIHAFDVVTLSSRTEGTPIVLLEAMAAGMPVIATRVGGVPRVVSPRDALLVEPEDPVAIARAVEAVRRDRAAAAARATAARDRLRRDFAVGPWVERVDQVYAAAIARHHSGSGR